ncbi:MAG: Mut7-C RNAse domain-containing protein [Parachlamydiales bacterium]|nr:Mut7-C RNAse domain-containing protein [Parachlamydiales bacterium]
MEKKFLCDHMCAELGRWLRAAGYDTEIVEGTMPDQAVFEKAVREKRRLLTHDRDFNNFDAAIVTYLQGESLDDWAGQLNIDWEFRPFSRCLKCNVILEKKKEGIWVCPVCTQTFWLGSHTERMLEQLKKWNQKE